MICWIKNDKITHIFYLKGKEKMAEKYGEIPKLFTKKWWGYFWEYYKVHTIVSVLIVSVAISTVYKIVTAPEYEFNIAYSAELDLSADTEEMFGQELSQYVTDSNGDGEDGVLIRQNNFMLGMEDAQVEQTLIMRMQLEMTDEDTIVYIIGEDKLKYMIDSPDMEGAFVPVENWLDSEVGEDKLYVFDGQAYAVKLDGSKMLSQYKIKSDDLYIAVRNYNKELSDEMKEKIANAINVANAIVE